MGRKVKNENLDIFEVIPVETASSFCDESIRLGQSPDQCGISVHCGLNFFACHCQ